jgi:hypothetical protein
MKHLSALLILALPLIGTTLPMSHAYGENQSEPSLVPSPTFLLPSREARLAIFDRVQGEMERLDGATLMVRASRPEPWARTMERLRREAGEAATAAEWAQVLRRVDNTYPNLHSYLELGEAFNSDMPKRVRPAVGLFAEVSSPHTTVFKVSRVDTNLPSTAEPRPEIGDRVVAINGRSIRWWQQENFTFCKFALRSQCDQDLFGNLLAETLGWSRAEPLTFAVERAEAHWTFTVPVEEWSRPSSKKSLVCTTEENRYTGFSLVYSGNRACVYTSEQQPETAILRITGFSYRTAETNPITSVHKEVEALLPWWKEHAHWKHLIIDVIENGGGQAPIEWYKLLLTKPFQEQYVRLRKSTELENDELRHALFWKSTEHELWLTGLKESGVYAATKPGSFLPPVPQFCARENAPCSEGMFTPFEQPFRGTISILVDQYCISSCDGFVWQLADKLRGRVRLVGHPPAGDPAWARITIDTIPDAARPGFFITALRPIHTERPAEALYSQIVNISLDTDAQGNRLDGVPFSVDRFVPMTLENRDRWADAALSAALHP